MLIGHAIPHYGHIEAEVFECRERSKLWALRNGHDFDARRISTCNIARSRNLIAKWSKNNGHDLLLMQDADTWADPTSGALLQRLLLSMREHNAAVSAAVYRKRGVADVQVLVSPQEPGEVYEPDWCAIGLALFDMSKLRDLPLPWFQFELSADGCDIVLGEDHYFWRKAKAAGYLMVADWTIPSYHRDVRDLANGKIDE